MMKKMLLTALAGLALLVGVFSPVKADGIIVPPRPCAENNCPPPHPHPMRQLNIRYHHVTVQIEDQIAVTRIDQVFHNPNSFPVEGTYIFPLPLDAVVNHFTLWIDGKPVEGKVLSAEEARQTYEDTVRQLKDPALLEYVGRGAVQASVFPIPPDGERRIELEYSQTLPAVNGLISYAYPLNTEKFSAEPIDEVTVKVEILSKQPVRAVYSSSHTVDVQHLDAGHVTASYTATHVLPDADFNLFYSVGESEAFHLFSYRDPGDPTDSDGFFMLLMAPKPGEVKQVVAKDVLLVLDHSGSMEGEKFQQAQSAAQYILQHLNAEDRFGITAFSTGVEMYATSLQPASQAKNASDWVNGLSAEGSTDINRALLETATMADPERPTYLIFLTDGLPTQGVTHSQDILNNLKQTARNNLRLFAFGVGYDVDTFLLDSLTQEHQGLSAYVQPGQALDEVLSSFYSRISSPLLTDLKLDFGGMQVYDLYPNPLPDLFSGSQIVITGRYRDGGSADVTLQGNVNGTGQTFRFPGQSFVQDSRTVRSAPTGLARLWATRKIGHLLNQVRLQGNNKEWVDQIVRLSIRYGIVTPYTSYLVTEPMPLGEGGQQRMVQNTYDQMQAQAAAPSFGATAVQKAADQGALSQAEVAAGISGDANQKVKVVGAHTFVLNDGIWMDTTYDPEKMKPLQVAFLSPDYFKLANSNPELAAALALGDQVIVMVDGTVYQITAEGKSVPPVIVPTPLVPTAIPVEEQPAQTATLNPAAVMIGTPVPNDPTESPVPSKAGGFTPGLIIGSCLGGVVVLAAAYWAFNRK